MNRKRHHKEISAACSRSIIKLWILPKRFGGYGVVVWLTVSAHPGLVTLHGLKLTGVRKNQSRERGREEGDVRFLPCQYSEYLTLNNSSACHFPVHKLHECEWSLNPIIRVYRPDWIKYFSLVAHPWKYSKHSKGRFVPGVQIVKRELIIDWGKKKQGKTSSLPVFPRYFPLVFPLCDLTRFPPSERRAVTIWTPGTG